MQASKHIGGIQAYSEASKYMGAPKCMGAYGHPIALTKCASLCCEGTGVYAPLHVWTSPMFGCPPVCLITPMCKWTPPYVCMPLYVWTPPYVWMSPVCLDTPICLVASIYLVTPTCLDAPYVWTPICLDDKVCFLCIVCSTALCLDAPIYYDTPMFGHPPYVQMTKHAFFVLCVPLLYLCVGHPPYVSMLSCMFWWQSTLSLCCV